MSVDRRLIGKFRHSDVQPECEERVDTVEKLRFASGAKIHEELNSVLRAIKRNG